MTKGKLTMKYFSFIRKEYRFFIFICVAIVILLCLFNLASTITNIPVNLFTRDPASIMLEKGVFSSNLAPLIGSLSHIGIILWCVSASICIFASCLLTQKEPVELYSRSQKSRYFLIYFGAFTSILLLDDLFLLHEEVVTIIFPQNVTYIFYLSISLFGIFKFWNTILTTEWPILCVGISFLLISVLMDITHVPIRFVEPILLEDGFKLLGIASWCTYFVLSAFQFVHMPTDKPNLY